ncbi:RNA-guided endonuclease InsQ/TnpB family protein [Nocardia inohanensis]|uniref:RNA-guided endonuclease InsQ/TnpB family protein n=1 Tax=Nocardia inohanensis TaxID=209246 RepID=UPI000A0508B9|nr:RNA-guided endonuclease TnpB family protein [Nocardia inohanensis]
MSTAVVKRGFRFRFYPTPTQEAELARTFGCVRKVYNLALEIRSQAWQQDRQRVTFNDTSAMLTLWKQTEELAFLNDVAAVPMQQALRHLQSAFTAFWEKRARFPRFKTRKNSRASAEYTRSGFRWRSGQLTLMKITGPLDIVWSRPLPEGMEPSTVTVSKDRAGRWFVSMRCDDPGIRFLPQVDSAIGIDAGLNSLVTLSTGEKIANPRYEERDRARLAKAQRTLHRKAVGSNNRNKARGKVARIHARIADRRRDFLHKLTTRLVRENQTLAIEDLRVSNMVKNHNVARAISDASWREFRTMLEYKASWYGRTVVVVDRWYPSSKLCSNCGNTAESIPLQIRTWTCGSCGSKHDRDVNAARNILAAGSAVTVCGDGVRPLRRIPDGQSSMKQKTLARKAQDFLSIR